MLKKTTRVAAKAAGGALAVGRVASAVFGLALVVGLTAGAASAAFGANGGTFVLGKGNVATALTSLAADVQGAALRVQNTDAGADDTALSLAVGQGEAPMRVNSDGKVANLNADELDGKDGAGFFSGKTYPLLVRQAGPGGGLTVQQNLVCDEGDVILGGGGRGQTGEDYLSHSSPFSDGKGWNATIEDNGNPTNLAFQALCADFPPLRP